MNDFRLYIRRDPGTGFMELEVTSRDFHDPMRVTFSGTEQDWKDALGTGCRELGRYIAERRVLAENARRA